VYNQLLAAAGLIIMMVALSVPRLSKRYLVLSRHRVLTVGTLIFVAEALYANIAIPLNYPVPNLVISLGFAVLLLSFGYVALEMTVSNERRLLSIDKELEIARQLQFSILPACVPEVPNLRISASYLPMTAVAGDFYQFVPIDEHRLGFLVADVSGHGVPAALIASMIKVAMHSVDGRAAHDPAEVLRRLGSTLSGELRGQFVSAAYLWIDSGTRTARYSAAGHPPLLCWRAAEGALTRIESNGLLFGVPVDADYPACNIALATGDRLFLYTDGFTEPENAVGESFGDRKLEQLVRDNQSCPAPELAERLLAELRAWQPAGLTQQDDITLIVIDVA
jgi:phosphoserine phosphatase RsbU/P